MPDASLNNHKIKRQQLIKGPDYPWFMVRLWNDPIESSHWMVTLEKADIGYTKEIERWPRYTILEANIKYHKIINECLAGKWDIIPLKEGEAFD